jgi:hypothetical protein
MKDDDEHLVARQANAAKPADVRLTALITADAPGEARLTAVISDDKSTEEPAHVQLTALLTASRQDDERTSVLTANLHDRGTDQVGR